ncbi:Predicted arabinose efflux permease, MFS family [Micromonospora pallida]|uniref:Predicted arabinose efflux permease, MFS family n=1 Tax=Micromonospora pallida TaxID=145854 RepID=A0A1C6S6K0_9ACTN|nr:MFS transporter [Micromonospora pallida]SCL25113.1 Predicted arabinose efflux permease, MFS family [Micromonospora pallida]
MADTATATRRRLRPRLDLTPLRSRNFRLLFAAESISVFGDAFHAVALPWLVYTTGGGARELGLLVAVYGLCRLATTPLGGILADRIGAWRVMLAADLVRLACTVGIAVAAVTGVRDLVPIGLLVAGTGLGAGLFQPAAYAITPRLLPPEQLQAGNALNSTAAFAAGLAGPGVAGLVVVALSPGAAFTVDALTFAVSAACLAAIGASHRRATPVVVEAGSPPAPRATFRQALRESPLLRTVLVVTAAANLTVGGMIRVGLPSLASVDLAAGAGGFGGLLAAFTGGSLAGGLFSAALTGVRRRGATAMLAGLVMAGAVALVPFAGYVGALVALAVAGVASTVTNVLIITEVQQRTAPHLLGRVMSAVLFAGLGLFPLSTVVAGLVVEAYGSTVLFLATAATLAAAFGFGLSRRTMREQ